MNRVTAAAFLSVALAFGCSSPAESVDGEGMFGQNNGGKFDNANQTDGGLVETDGEVAETDGDIADTDGALGEGDGGEPEVDPFETLPGARPPWYLLAPFGFLEWASSLVPAWLAGSVLFLAFFAFLAVPFLDRSREDSRWRPLALVVGAVVFILWALFTAYGVSVA